ncbi:HlyD family type I secretion periplasmic adaptor subunit [Azospirillum soli]|uniref:HlyD family type I secretion periplasmic adaptor subunit n=1 Tax=Azospirillum soli TaxID=1304799 RepID=UPI001AE311A4|nr:HlyD family type I secretion periplasmic adaptor subunit [Azospirillum soli]MBP2315833.1 HlyD family secretion protein [Azospirillum soli]
MERPDGSPALAEPPHASPADASASATKPRAPKPRTGALSAFQSAATAIEERPIPWPARAILHSIVALIAILLVWASLSVVDRVVVASGRLITTKSLIIVQPLETGVIRTLDVSVGAAVRAGDRLATLDPTFAEADATGLEERLTSLTAEAERLRSEIDGTPFIAPPNDPVRAFQAQLYEQRLAEDRSHIASLDSKLQQLDAGLAANRQAQRSLQERLKVVSQILGMREELVRRGVGSQLQFMEAQLNQLAIKEQLAAKTAEEKELEHQLAAARFERQSYDRERQRSSSEKLLAVSREMDATRQQLAKAKRRTSLVELRAPADGVVLEIAQRSVGSVAREADPLITIVPMNVPLEVEAEIKTADISRIRTGQSARIKLEALPYQQHGHLEGAVRVISDDAFRPENDKSRSIYRARVSIDRENLRNIPPDFRLIPGMSASVEIVIGHRSVISYFLYPALRVFNESLREP